MASGFEFRGCTVYGFSSPRPTAVVTTGGGGAAGECLAGTGIATRLGPGCAGGGAAAGAGAGAAVGGGAVGSWTGEFPASATMRQKVDSDQARMDGVVERCRDPCAVSNSNGGRMFIAAGTSNLEKLSVWIML